MIIIQNHIKLSIVKFVIFIELIVYCIFIYIDYTNNLKIVYSSMLKYFGILLCLFLVILIGNNGHDKKDTMFLRLAFFLTAVADLCMVILNLNDIGIMIFCLVQITYIMRHRRSARKKGNFIFAVVSVIFAILIGMVFTNKLGIKGFVYSNIKESTITIGIIYAAILIYSVYISWKTLKETFYPIESRYLIAIGITLFLFCDINVALSSILKKLSIWIWIFYLPSQVLLALSGYNKKFFK